jgi:type I restriction enzyme, S subunit
MASEWETVTLDSLIERDRGITYGIVQPGAAVPDGIPIVRVSDIRNGRIATSDPLRVKTEIEAAHKRTRLRGGELLLTLVGTVGEAAIVPTSLAGWNTARAVAVVPVRKEIGAYWVQLALRSADVRDRIGSRVNTTVQTTLNLRDVAQLPIVLPPPSERQAIAHVLGTLDDKIELNRRMNKTLAATAEALFKSWFADFDPVRAKATGSDPNLPKPLYDLFPDTFEESVLGKIPKGWRVVPVGELADVVGGGTPSTKESEFWDDGCHYWVTPKDLSALDTPVLLSSERKITDLGLSQIGSGLLAPGTVLLSSRAPIGYLAVSEVPIAINQGFIGMLPSKGIPNLFLLYWAKYAHEKIVSRANGSTFLEISKSNFRPIPVVTPTTPVLQAFERIVRPAYARIVCNEKESRALAASRDTLLPKLMSGKVRVKDAERIIGGSHEQAQSP